MSAKEITVECKLHFKNGNNGSKKIENGDAPEPVSVEPGRIPRVTRLMALAIRFDGLLKSGQMRDFADIANLGYVSRARLTQIMNLLLLAPDIQEEILFLPRTLKGYDPITESQLRPVCAEVDWAKQRQIWGQLRGDNN